MWSRVALAEALLAGLRTHIENLRSGSVEFTVLDKNGATTVRRFVAFDNPAGNVRSDAEVLRDSRIVRVVQTKKQFLQFVSRENGGLLTRLNPGEKSIVSEGMPFDVRAVGLCSYRELAIGGRVEGVLKTFSSGRVRSASAALEKDVGVLDFEMNIDGPVSTHLVYWIDTTRDYVPLRCEVRIVGPFGGSTAHERIETSWEKVNDTWIPTRSVWLGIHRNTVTSIEDMRFTWKSVNEKVPETLFSEESLKLPKNTYIVDTRLGKPILEKVIGAEGKVPGTLSQSDMPSTSREKRPAAVSPSGGKGKAELTGPAPH